MNKAKCENTFMDGKIYDNQAGDYKTSWESDWLLTTTGPVYILIYFNILLLEYTFEWNIRSLYALDI